MYFSTYGLRKTWLDKCLKSPVSEDPLTSNMGDEPNKIFGLLFNPMTAADKYSLLIRDKL